MISKMNTKNSLTFYQPLDTTSKNRIPSSYFRDISTVSSISTSYITANNTNTYNNQLNNFLNTFHSESNNIANKITSELANNSNYTGSRSSGINLAWKYEKADISMGGNGSANWNHSQKQEILTKGKVSGAEGHHQKNVFNHPNEQGDPNNIKFYKSKKEHLEYGHKGNFKNKSNADKIDKDKMLKNTNNKRLFKNELKGLGISIAIGAGIGFTIGFATSLAESGITPDSVKYAFINGGKSSITSGIQSITGYTIARTIGQTASNALTGILSNVGIEITQNISTLCNMTAIGGITIAVFSTITFISLIHKGESIKSAIIQTSKQALFSLSILAITIITQFCFGGYCGIIISASIGLFFIVYSIIDIVDKKELSEKLRKYVIEKSKPQFIY